MIRLSHTDMESIEQAIEYFESRKNFYVRCHTASTLAIIGISFTITVSTALNLPATLVVVLGAVLSALIAIERAFDFSDKRAMYKHVLGQAQTLQWDIRDAETEADRARAKKRCKALLVDASRYDAKRSLDNR